MTMSIAWVRNAGPTPELVFASDSRLTGGYHVDNCQKIFALPREDCCISFAGHTYIAYPFIMQLQNVISSYKDMLSRRVDINKIHGRVVGLLNWFISTYTDPEPTSFLQEKCETSFLFGGWSWQNSKFLLWRIFYEAKLGRYISAKTNLWKGHGVERKKAVPLAVIGDYQSDFFERVQKKLSNVTSKIQRSDQFTLNYEPLQVLSEMLIDPKFTLRSKENQGAIGGGPQLTIVYPYLRTTDFAVEWELGPKFVYVLNGRVVADFENFGVPGIDPFTGSMRTPVKGRESDEDPLAWADVTTTGVSEVVSSGGDRKT